MKVTSKFTFEDAELITKHLINHELGRIFYDAVRKDDELLPDYYKIITEPIFLSTIEQKLNENQYKDTKQWVNDVYKLINNALKYFGKENYCSYSAIELKKFFEKLLMKIDTKSVAGYMRYAKHTFEKIDSLLKNVPKSIYAGDENKNLVGISKKFSQTDILNFIVASSFLGSKSDVLSFSQILECNGVSLDPRSENVDINVHKLSDDCLNELIEYAKERFSDNCLPYPETEDM